MRFLTLLSLVTLVASAQTPIEDTIQHLFAVKHFRQAAISPDGKQVAWVQQVGDGQGSAIYRREIDAGHAVHITAGPDAFSERSIAWSPDSSEIAFLSDAEQKGQFQLYVVSADKPGHPRKLTGAAGYLSDPQWSPDGTKIAVLFTAGAPRNLGPLEATQEATGVIQSEVYEQRIAIVDPKTGAMRELTPKDMYVYEYDWAPDSHRLVYTSAHGAGDDNWWIARLYTVDLGSGRAQEIYKPELQIAIPKWSPDGKSIAFITGLMSDAGVTGGDIYVVGADGSNAHDVTPGYHASPCWLTWLPSSKRILFTEHTGGAEAIKTLDLATGQMEQVWKGDESVSAGTSGFGTSDISLSHDGTRSALIRNSFSNPPEVWAGATGEWRKITDRNAGIKPEWGEARSIEWTNGGFHVQGWLLMPMHYDATKRYPMVVSVHGGPASAVTPAWRGPFFNLGTLSSQGFFVFFPNPRGSYGQGEAFTEANRKDFGYGDLRDILAGVDQVEKMYPVDDRRVGISGWSYGGYMTMWAVTQTNRFRAAVAGAGIADWLSYYGENSIDQWMIPYFGASVYADPAVYAKSAPIHFIKNVRTPTLVVVGQRDGECPAPQSFEFWHALKSFGVRTELVVYANEGHGFRNPEHMRDLMQRTLEWFDQNLK
jgi:acylaminoacyl-peptidase